MLTKRLGVSGLLALSACLFLVSFAAGDCSGHGTRSGDRCNCNDPAPSQAGEKGYVGENCEIRAFGVQIDGDDVTKTCSTSGCNKLAPEEWVCFYSPVTWNDSSAVWNYLTVQLNRTSSEEDGDPDLYGLFYSGTAEGKSPVAQTYSYDFRETSSSSHRTVTKRVQKKDFSDQVYKGVYMCVKAYGYANVTFSLRASLSKCPSDFTVRGERMECSTPVSAVEKRHTGCTESGVCQCKPPYTKPLPQTYDGLGFEDCSARVSNIADQAFYATHTYAAQHELISRRAWNFYAFNISSDDYQVIVNVAGETDAANECGEFGYFGAFAKYGQPPGWHYGQWDFRPQWDYYSEDDSDIEIAFDQRQEGFQTGQWYVGINGDDTSDCKYTLTISKYECPLNCTNQGRCEVQSNGTRACRCNEGYFGIDCSRQAAALSYGNPVRKPETPFEYEYYELPAITPAMLTHSVEVRFTASFSSSTYGSWTAAKPELLLLKGDHSAHPTAGNYTFKATLESQNQSYHLDLCPSQLKQGIWRAAVYNPMRIYEVAYNLTVTKQGLCLNNCSSHGTCTEDGVCNCSGNWAGGDCSIDTSASTCQQGTRLATKRPEQHGVCWRECSCDSSGNCGYQQNCADFTCDSPKMRRKGSEAECIQDECTQGAWEDKDSHSCMRDCQCPADGSACKLSGNCNAGSFACKDGFKRFSDKSARCYPVGCQEGALQEASAVSVENGKAYATCTCGSSQEEQEGQPLCTVRGSDPHQMSLVCKEGYSLKGAEQQGTSKVWLGGSCISARPGTPAWGVVLWVFFSLLAGGAGGVALLWVYERKLRTGYQTDGLYHELSMDTGF